LDDDVKGACDNPLAGLLGAQEACDLWEATTFTKVQFMAELSSALDDGLDEVLLNLLNTSTGGVTAALFDDDKTLNFIMTGFGIGQSNGANGGEYMTLGLDICESTEATAGVSVSNSCASSYDLDEVESLYELTICSKTKEWNDDIKQCE
jgi:hypothetical protein